MSKKKQKKIEEAQNKIHFIMNMVLGVLFVIVLFSAYLYHTGFGREETGVFNNPDYTFEIIDNRVILFNSGIKLNEFQCYDECSVYLEEDLYYFYNGRILLQDGDVLYLYDLVNNRRLSNEFREVKFILDNEENIRLFRVSDGYRYGVMNLNGNLQIDLIYDGLGNLDENGLLTNYNFEGGYITALTGELWGKVALENGGGLIDFQYEDIRLSDYQLLAVKEGGLWYLVDEANIRVISEGFEAMDIYEEFLIVVSDEEVYVINFEGEVISNKLPIYLPIDPWLFNTQNNGLYTKIVEGIVYIYIGQIIDETFHQERFIFNQDTKEIVSVS